MKIDIRTVDMLRIRINEPGHAGLAQNVLENLTQQIQDKGYYLWQNPRSGKSYVIPWHAITAIEQADMVDDIELYEPQRINE